MPEMRVAAATSDALPSPALPDEMPYSHLV